MLHRKISSSRIINTMNTHQKIFQSVVYAEPSSGLEERILLAIEEADHLARRKKLLWSQMGLVFSSVAAVLAVIFYGQEFFASSFWSMVSLAFSDAQVVALYWSEFSLSLIETFPLQAVMFMIVPSFALLLFLNMYFSIPREHHFHYNNRTHFA